MRARGARSGRPPTPGSAYGHGRPVQVPSPLQQVVQLLVRLGQLGPLPLQCAAFKHKVGSAGKHTVLGGA